MRDACFANPAPVTRRVRAYFAPVNRQSTTPVLFDAAFQGAFDLDCPPSPWIDLGWIQGFTRKSETKSIAILTGIPAAVREQVRSTVEAVVTFQFLKWTKLTMALATGSQHMNLLAPTGMSQAADSKQALPAAPIQSRSTATSIALAPVDASKFAAGSWIAVDEDYAGQTGFVGTPVAGAYLRQAVSDVDYIRRMTFNVGLVTQVEGNCLTLAGPLPGGAPVAGEKVQAIVGFTDREGGSFYQEWSALFVMEGSQGERVFFHYPRLQPMAEAAEESDPLDCKRKAGLQRLLLCGRFMALPVADSLDGERVLCYRSYLPAPNALI